MEAGKETKNGKRSNNSASRLMKAKRSLDEAMAQLGDHPKLRERVAAVREELLQAFIEQERSSV